MSNQKLHFNFERPVIRLYFMEFTDDNDKLTADVVKQTFNTPPNSNQNSPQFSAWEKTICWAEYADGEMEKQITF